MRTFIEITQTECECIAMIAAPLSHFYNIKANVELKPAIGRRLIISINPPLNSICNDELLYDGSKLPEDMVADWLVDRLEPYQQLKKYDVISSSKEERKINIKN